MTLQTTTFGTRGCLGPNAGTRTLDERLKKHCVIHRCHGAGNSHASEATPTRPAPHHATKPRHCRQGPSCWLLGLVVVGVNVANQVDDRVGGTNSITRNAYCVGLFSPPSSLLFHQTQPFPGAFGRPLLWGVFEQEPLQIVR